MNKKIGKRGFTLIELIVVMAVIAILVLLATPKFLNYTKQARETVIKHDIVVVEGVLTEYLIRNNKYPSNWNSISMSELKSYAEEEKLYDREGITDVVENGNYVEVDRDFLAVRMRTSLKGNFYANEDGTVYYLDIKGGTKPIELTEKDLDFDREVQTEITNDESKIKILSYQFPNGIYTKGDTIKGNVKIQGVQAGTYQINAIMIHSKSGEEIPMTTSFNIGAGETKTIEFSHIVTIANRLGFYNLEVSINQGETVLTKYSVSQTIFIGSSEWEYFYDNDFIKVEMEKIGQIGALDSKRVSFDYILEPSGIDYSSARIDILANDNATGQIKTKLPITYGTYEAKIKVPNSDALLNGFFLYGVNKNNPEITYEIDMEIIYYEGRWQLWATVFNPSHKDYVYNGEEPGVIYQKKMDLPFDPSSDFHSYRMDFYRNYISFALDGVEIGRWNNVFDYGEMYMHVGTFYTHWLSKTLSTTDKQMDIQWMRRAFNGK